MDFKKLRNKSRFYFGKPGDVRPPTAGLWLNRSTKQFEVWDYVQKKKASPEFLKIAYAENSIEQCYFESWLFACTETMAETFGLEGVFSWLSTGLGKPKPAAKISRVH